MMHFFAHGTCVIFCDASPYKKQMIVEWDLVVLMVYKNNDNNYENKNVGWSEW